MTRRLFSSIAGAAAAAPVVPDRAGAADPLDIGSRRELMVDGELIAGMRGVDLRLASPVYAGPVLRFDRPWEGAFCAYTTVLQDEDRLRLYYRGVPASGKDGNAAEVTCYAESPDGIRWSRPDLGLYEVRGTRANNVILAGAAPLSHNFTPFIDTRPGVPAAERYKALAGVHTTGLVGFVSADGVRWKKIREAAVFPPREKFAFDSQNLAFWSGHEGRYVLYYRTWKKIGNTNYRWVSRAVSDDFLSWTPAGEMSYGDAPPEHIYTNQTSPYFRAPHIYLGICARFMPGRQVLTEAQAREVRLDPRYFKDCSDVVLATSRGGNRYSRAFMEAFLRPGTGLENWASRSNYPALNLAQTGPASMSLYVNRNYGQATAYLGRYELRLDGIASAHGGYAGGELVTRPLVFDGSRLELNYSTSAAGSVRVEIQDAAGAPAPGFSLAEAPELVGDEIARTYEWRGGPHLGALRGRPVRLRVLLKDADLYAFRFHA